MKTRVRSIKYSEPKSAPLVLREAVALPGLGLTFPVRLAKAKLSALLDLVASGQEVVITSDGKPKARLVGAEAARPRKVFTGMGDHLKSMPVQKEGPFADELVRADRDGRGW
jgi:prevent-host-death family protein